MSVSGRGVSHSVLIDGVARGKTDREIADAAGASIEAVARLRRRLGIKPNHVPRVQRTFSDDALRRCIVDRGMTDAEAAAELGVCQDTLSGHRRALGLPVNRKVPQPISVEAARACIGEGLSNTAAAARLGCSVGAFASLRRDLMRKTRAAPPVAASVVQVAVRRAFALAPSNPKLLRLLEPHLAAEMGRCP